MWKTQQIRLRENNNSECDEYKIEETTSQHIKRVSKKTAALEAIRKVLVFLINRVPLHSIKV